MNGKTGYSRSLNVRCKRYDVRGKKYEKDNLYNDRCSHDHGSLRKKGSEDEKFIKFDREKEKYIFMNKIKAYDIRKTDSFTHQEGKKHFYNKRSNDTELIISDMDPRNESYENHFLNNGKRNRYNSKSVKNVIRFSSIKRKLNKSKKKKVTFANKFVEIIDIENYKKYYRNEYWGDNAIARCTCIIY